MKKVILTLSTALAISNVSAQITDTIAKYNFDGEINLDAGATVIDISSNGLDLIVQNNIVQGSGGPFGNGKHIDNSASAGVDLSIQSPTLSSPISSGAAFTISAWVYTDALPVDNSTNNRQMFFGINNNSGQYLMYIGDDGALRGRFTGNNGGGTQFSNSDPSVITTSTWHNAVMSYSGATANVISYFVDGVAAGTKTLGDTIPEITSFYINKMGASAPSKVDEVRLYLGTVTAADLVGYDTGNNTITSSPDALDISKLKFANPVSSGSKLEISNITDGAEVILSSLTGETLINVSYNGGVDVNSLNKGMYLLSVKENGLPISSATKIIIK